MRVPHRLMLSLFPALLIARTACAQVPPVTSPAILVELFTSEGCSSCPPADELLRKINGQRTADGSLIIGISEHVSYWDRLGWKDPFSSDLYTDRQNEYSTQFHLDGPYTPQMVVNGREQLVGNDSRSLLAALAQEDKQATIQLQITSIQQSQGKLSFSYTATKLLPNQTLQIMAAIVDDSAESHVRRGENSGRALQHVFVVRTLADVGTLRGEGLKQATLILPPSLPQSSPSRHLILFAQQRGLGAVLGAVESPL